MLVVVDARILLTLILCLESRLIGNPRQCNLVVTLLTSHHKSTPVVTSTKSISKRDTTEALARLAVHSWDKEQLYAGVVSACLPGGEQDGIHESS